MKTAADDAALLHQAAAWRAEALHKRWLYIDTIDRVPVDLLLALIERACPQLPAPEGPPR